MKKVLIALLVLFALLFVLTSSNFYKSSAKKSESISPNILYITSPVTSLSGKVEKIAGNKITVKMMTVTYHVIVTDKTQIYQPPLSIGYLFKTTTLPGAPVLPTTTSKLTVKDVKIDQLITVNTMNDLRILVGDTFEAVTINLPPITNTLNGRIISLEGSVLTVKGFAPVNGGPMNPGNTAARNDTPAAPQEKEYRVTLTSDTEISRMVNESMAPVVPIPPKPEKFTPSDLKKDMRVMVYTAQDVNENSQLTALRIEPIIQP